MSIFPKSSESLVDYITNEISNQLSNLESIYKKSCSFQSIKVDIKNMKNDVEIIKHCQNEIKDEIDHLKTENKKATESILDLIKTEFKKQELDKRECSCFQKRQKFKSKNKAEQQFLKIKKNPSNSSEDSSIKSIMIIEEKKICDILLSQNNIKNKRKQKQSQNIEFERLKKNNSKIAAGHASPTYTSAKLEESNGQLSLPISSLNKTCVLATKRKEMLNKLCNKYSKNDKKNEVKREKNIDKISTRATCGRGKKKANKS